VGMGVKRTSKFLNIIYFPLLCNNLKVKKGSSKPNSKVMLKDLIRFKAKVRKVETG